MRCGSVKVVKSSVAVVRNSVVTLSGTVLTDGPPLPDDVLVDEDLYRDCEALCSLSVDQTRERAECPCRAR